MVILPFKKSSPTLLLVTILSNLEDELFIFKKVLLVQQLLIYYKDLLFYYT